MGHHPVRSIGGDTREVGGVVGALQATASGVSNCSGGALRGAAPGLKPTASTDAISRPLIPPAGLELADLRLCEGELTIRASLRAIRRRTSSGSAPRSASIPP